MMIEKIILVLVIFLVVLYCGQIMLVIMDLAMGKVGELSKKQIRLLLIPLSFIPILVEKYKERGE